MSLGDKRHACLISRSATDILKSERSEGNYHRGHHPDDLYLITNYILVFGTIMCVLGNMTMSYFSGLCKIFRHICL